MGSGEHVYGGAFVQKKSVQKKKLLEISLTTEQKKRVQENLGLVAVHLRRFVHNLVVPRRDREWEDLFQEGCMGLIKATMTYREDSGIEFAAYALPRIHNAVSRALDRKFTTIIFPPRRKKRVEGDSSGSLKSHDPSRPKEYSLVSDVSDSLHDPRHHNPDFHAENETIGERLRCKYERAVFEAADTINRRTSTRGDRDELVQWITRERFLIPQQESRRALRQIARDTKSSYARVAQCDKLMAQLVRNFLEEDPEFNELQKCRRNDVDGVERFIDPEMEIQLRHACIGEYIKRYHKADREVQANMLHAVMGAAGGDVEVMIHQLFTDLSSRDREQLLRNNTSRTKQGSAKTKKHRNTLEKV